MSASDWHMMEQELESCKHLLGELYQILGQFQDEIPMIVLDKIIAHVNESGEYNGKFADEFEDLLPWYRDEK